MKVNGKMMELFLPKYTDEYLKQFSYSESKVMLVFFWQRRYLVHLFCYPIRRERKKEREMIKELANEGGFARCDRTNKDDELRQRYGITNLSNLSSPRICLAWTLSDFNTKTTLKKAKQDLMISRLLDASNTMMGTTSCCKQAKSNDSGYLEIEGEKYIYIIEPSENRVIWGTEYQTKERRYLGNDR